MSKTRPPSPCPPAMTRAAFLRLASLASAAILGGAARARAAASTTMQTRPIPSTGERLPVIGCGTWRTFDVGSSAPERAQRAEVLRVLFEAAGSVIDTSPMYGSSEAVVGALLTAMKAHDRAFLATKVWTRGRAAGIAQMQQSMRLLQADRIDLMQIHNLVDWRTHLATLRAWKSEGRIRHLGITHYHSGAFDELEAVSA